MLLLTKISLFSLFPDFSRSYHLPLRCPRLLWCSLVISTLEHRLICTRLDPLCFVTLDPSRSRTRAWRSQATRTTSTDALSILITAWVKILQEYSQRLLWCVFWYYLDCLLHRQKRLGPQSSSTFPPIPSYDPGLAAQINGLREENARLRHETQLAITQAQTWK